MNKTELDIIRPQQIREATEFINRYKCPAIVVPPDLVTMAIVARGVVSGNYKIITTVDWPKGTQYMMDKFRGLPTEALSADGFEILLTKNNKANTIKEVRFISEFFRAHFNTMVELRFVLGFGPERDEANITDMVESMKTIPSPTMIRTTHLTKVISANGSVESHQKIIKLIRDIRPAPIKISGNVNRQVRMSCIADRFACTLEQAQSLLKEMSNPDVKNIDKAINSNQITKS